MPIYEYQCSQCGHQLESLQKVSDPALTTCPSCGKEGLQKLVSASSFQLKGTGWYATDFKDKGKGDNKSDKKGSSDKKDTGSTSGESSGSTSSDSTSKSDTSSSSGSTDAKSSSKDSKKTTAN